MALTEAQEAARKKRVMRGAQNVVRRLVIAVVEDNTPIKSGALQASTHVTFRGRICTITQLFYGKFVEFGTRFITPRRFIQRALRQLQFNPQLRAIQRELGITFRFMYFGRVVG